MNLLQLRYFYEVARSRSFSETAKSMRISQPAISKMVQSLEAHFDRKLFHRSNKQIQLTEDGEILFRSAAKIFHEARNVEEELKSASGKFSGSYCLGVSDNIALYLIPKVLGRFKEAHPALNLSLFAGTSGQIKTELLYDRCQLGIFYTPLKTSEPFESREILQTEFVIVIGKKSPFAKKGALKLSDVVKRGVPRIESRHSDYASGFPAHFHSHRLGLSSAPWLEVNQHEIKKQLVLEGFGYALLTRHTVAKELKRGELLLIEAGQKLPAPIYAVWKKGRKPGRISEVFLESFRKAVG